MPEIPPSPAWRKELRKIALPEGINEDKNPDALINGKHIVEFKTSETNTLQSIKDLLKKGSKQADIVCVKLTGETPKDLKRMLKGHANVSKRLKEVWLIDEKDVIVKYTKEEMLNF